MSNVLHLLPFSLNAESGYHSDRGSSSDVENSPAAASPSNMSLEHALSKMKNMQITNRSSKLETGFLFVIAFPSVYSFLVTLLIVLLIKWNQQNSKSSGLLATQKKSKCYTEEAQWDQETLPITSI